MPKLTKAAAKKVANASSSFEPIEDGVYHARLRSVTVSDKPGASGSHYWKWEFEIVEEPYVNRRLWTNTSLAESAAFKLNETFAAFDEDTTTDTDDLCGRICKLVVSTGVIQGGARKGEIGNAIERLAAADEDFEADKAASESSSESLL